MTPAHINAMERAARIYCKKIGMDPDVTVPMPHETLQGVVDQVPFWKMIAEKMIDLALMLASMKEAGATAASDGAVQH